MNRAERQAVAATVLSVVVGGAMAWAGSRDGIAVSGVPLFALGALLAFAINWVAFVPAYLGRTERHFDLTGSITYLALVGLALTLQPVLQPRALLLGGLVVIWALRLGTFLFARVRRAGRDRRFDELKTSLWRFLMSWSLQAMWVLLTMGCALAAMTSQRVQALDLLAATGTVVWATGFGIEVAADLQKRHFRADPANAGRYVRSGLWAWSRHPNYFGEIVLWVGIALVAVPALSGWQHVTLVSPVFVYLLLTRISGIPLLEASADKRWGDDPEYQAYRDATPVLLLRRPRCR
jgi:steroid 5-alpha reductase family enzyme